VITSAPALAPSPVTPAGVTSPRLVRVEFLVPACLGGSFADLVAEFMSWVPLPMDLRSDGSLAITVCLEANRCWRYRFLVDGEQWINDFDADEFVDHADGGYISVFKT